MQFVHLATYVRIGPKPAPGAICAGPLIYIGALRERLDELDPPERKRISEWCQWAADWADRSDPALYTELIVGFDERDEYHRPRYAR